MTFWFLLSLSFSLSHFPSLSPSVPSADYVFLFSFCSFFLLGTAPPLGHQTLFKMLHIQFSFWWFQEIKYFLCCVKSVCFIFPPESQLFFKFCFWLSEEKNGGAVTVTQSIMVFVLNKKNKNLSACICKMSVSQNTVPQCSAEVMSFIQSNWSQWNSVCGSQCIMKLFLSFSKKKLFFPKTQMSKTV